MKNTYKLLTLIIICIGGAFSYSQFQKLTEPQPEHTHQSRSAREQPAFEKTTVWAETQASPNKIEASEKSPTISASHLDQKAQTSQEAIDQLTKTEQKSLWSAFAEARRGIYSIAESKSEREENIGYDFYAVHPKQKLTTRFGPEGVQIVSSQRTYTEADLETPSTAWSAKMKLISFAGNEIPLGTSAHIAKEGATYVEYQHTTNLTEWYNSSAEAMEHGYTINQRPSHLAQGENVVIEVALDGLTTSEFTNEDGSYQLNFLDGERDVLSYSKLIVFDANGVQLPASMRATDSGFDIAYHDAGASYPITIDPLIVNEEAKLIGSDAAEGDQFGSSVAISGDSVVVGSPYDDDGERNSGSTYVFNRNGTTWTLQAKLTANDAAGFNLFGLSVAISDDTIVVGAQLDDNFGSNSGSAYVFNRFGTSWSQQAKLTANDAAEEDQFGRSVAISGGSIVVGTPQDDDAGNLSGSAYVFNRSGTTWTQQAKLTANDAAEEDQFGYSVAISGDSIVIGAIGNDDAGNLSGSAYVFNRSGNTWPQQTKLTSNDAAEGDRFGYSVAISGDTIVVGARLDDDEENASGLSLIHI